MKHHNDNDWADHLIRLLKEMPHKGGIDTIRGIKPVRRSSLIAPDLTDVKGNNRGTQQKDEEIRSYTRLYRWFLAWHLRRSKATGSSTDQDEAPSA